MTPIRLAALSDEDPDDERPLPGDYPLGSDEPDEDDLDEDDEPIEEEEEEEDFTDFLKDVEAPPAPAPTPTPAKPDLGDILTSLLAKAKAAAPAKPRGRRSPGLQAALGAFAYAEDTFVSTGYILLQVETRCQCGAVSRTTNGIFLERKHKHGETVWKRVAPGSLIETLPRRKETRSMDVEVCLECAPRFGF